MAKNSLTLYQDLVRISFFLITKFFLFITEISKVSPSLIVKEEANSKGTVIKNSVPKRIILFSKNVSLEFLITVSSTLSVNKKSLG